MNKKTFKNRQQRAFLALLAAFSLCNFFPLFSGGSEDFVVALETESQLLPVSIALEGKSSLFSQNYLSKLEDIFRFDFANNGMTFVNQEKDAPSMFKIKISVNAKNLFARLSFSREEDEDVTFGDVSLSGNMNEDRRVFHQLADKIHEHLFGFLGVASTRVLFTVRKKEGSKEVSEVWLSDYDGGNPCKIAGNFLYSITPEFIPPKPGFASGSFVFVDYQTGQPKIYAATLEQGIGQSLLTLSGNQLMPTVSRQRDRIAFISDVAGNPDLFIQDFDPEKGVLGKPRHLFSSSYAVQGSPTFSPEGTRIAFVSNKSGTPRIYVIKIPPPSTPLKEMNPQLISKFTRDNTAPSWSPDGTKIAYCGKVDGVRQIMIYDFLTGKERVLTKGRGNKENPKWAPNSLNLIYNTSDVNSCELYLINLKQSKALKIETVQGEKRFPSWEPRVFP